LDDLDDLLNMPEAKLVPVNKQCGFVISAADAAASDIDVDISFLGSSTPTSSSSGIATTLPYRVTDNKDGTFAIQYTPRAVGELVIDLRVKGVKVKGDMC
jgi:hypothetical protein